jgi:hypothetical protein
MPPFILQRLGFDLASTLPLSRRDRSRHLLRRGSPYSERDIAVRRKIGNTDPVAELVRRPAHWRPGLSGRQSSMALRMRQWRPVLEVLVLIALASTVIALALQRLFGPLPMLIVLGQLLAATGAAGFAIWLRRKGKKE